MPNHAEESEVRANLTDLPNGIQVAVIRLVSGETAWDPTNTHRTIEGPARLDYFLYPDGGWTVQVSELDRDL